MNLWYDRAVMDDEFVGLPGRQMQWVFDKRRVFGESASHLSLVASGAEALAAQDTGTLVAWRHVRSRARSRARGTRGSFEAP